MTYNLTNLTSSDNFLEYSIAVNQLTGGLLFAIFILIGGLVVYSRIEGTESQKLAATAFFCFVASAILNAIGLMDSFFVKAYLFILLGSAVFLLNSKWS